MFEIGDTIKCTCGCESSGIILNFTDSGAIARIVNIVGTLDIIPLSMAIVVDKHKTKEIKRNLPEWF